MTDVYIYQLNGMPGGFRDAVSPGWEDDCTVYLNADMPYKMKLKALNHAIGHVKDEDFWSGKDVQQIEADAHKRRPI